MKILYTKHALQKFMDLESLGVKISKILIAKIIKNPLHLDATTDFPKKIASGELDATHTVRIVYKEENDTIMIVTFYPARKTRYF